MATHFSTLAWKIPWTEEPGRLQSMWSRKVGHAWVTSLSLFTFMHWRRKWKPSPVLLPGESQGQRSLVGCRLWGCTESDTTEATYQQQHLFSFPLPFASLLFSALCKTSSDNHFAFLHFFFLGMVLIPASYTMSWTSFHSSSGTLSIRSNPLNLYFTSTV